jgi:uncharacterized protein (TIGR03435 family)
MATGLRTLVAPQPMLPIWINPEVPSAPWLAQLQVWALPIWSMGVLLFSVRLAWGCAHAFALGRRSDPADEPVLAIVRAVGRRMGIGRPVRVLISALSDGPSVIGWLRPVILLPPAAAMGLTPQQLEAVLAHELAHIRRWDYLVNVFQVVAETVFFYHPAVWWTSSRIRLERELCCDDLAVRSCGDPLCYAQALTTLEKRRVSAPAMAVAGTGGPLLYRIQRLLGVSTRAHGLSLWPGVLAIFLVLMSAALNLNLTQLLAQTGADAPQFEVASVKPHKSDDGLFGILGQPGGRFTATNASLRMLIRTAYQLQEDQIIGGPGWLGSDHFDIVAKAHESVVFGPTRGGQGAGDMQLMLRALLADRFRLTTHKETRDLPIFTLVTARSDSNPGPQLRAAAIDCAALAAARAGGGPRGPGAAGRSEGRGADPGAFTPPASADRPPCGMRIGPGTIVAGGTRMPQLATALSTWVNRIVVDRTGLTGSYDIDLQWTPDQMPFGPGGDPPLVAAAPPPIDPNRPSIFTALQEQLGLKLDSQRGPVEVLVIDSAERPTED